MAPTPQLSKIINDPVHGFITVPRGLLLDLIDSPEFQRLRRIKQMGMGSLVYPGAQHTRFSHALGAFFLTGEALDVLRGKGVEISDEEYEATQAAILLHDVGHGPFSHALEKVIIRGLNHEHMSLALMHRLNERFEGKLSLTIDIFEGKYPRKFLHQLVSSQLDMDRLDYLVRDSFFTGVVEGSVGADRIIKVLNVYEDQLVCESKGIYSIENFIVARRLMYWQVYLHKAAMAAEQMLVHILMRVRELVENHQPVWLSDNLKYFFNHEVSPSALNEEVLRRYLSLDDTDVEFALKEWTGSTDRVLANLCKMLVTRDLLKTRIQAEPIPETEVTALQQHYASLHGLTEAEAAYFVFSGEVHNQAYYPGTEEPIVIIFRDGNILDLPSAADLTNIRALAEPVIKHYMCFPGELRS